MSGRQDALHPERTHHGHSRGGAFSEDLDGDVTLEPVDAREAPEPCLTGEGQRLPFLVEQHGHGLAQLHEIEDGLLFAGLRRLGRYFVVPVSH